VTEKGDVMSDIILRDPTHVELLLGAIGIQDDISWYTWRDSAVRQGYGTFEADYAALCNKAFGFVPDRIHNLGPANIWGYPPGPACCWPENLGAIPPGPYTQPQIDAFNACTPKEAVIMANQVSQPPVPSTPTPA
jgi:hypothetical protein